MILINTLKTRILFLAAFFFLSFNLFADVDGGQKLIIGAQHHIYTVLSIIVFCNSLNDNIVLNDLFHRFFKVIIHG